MRNECQHSNPKSTTTRPKTTQRVCIDVTCIQCKKLYTVTCCADDYDDFKAGELIQNALPYLSEGDRELLISQICDSCFEEIFA